MTLHDILNHTDLAESCWHWHGPLVRYGAMVMQKTLKLTGIQVSFRNILALANVESSHRNCSFDVHAVHHKKNTHTDGVIGMFRFGRCLFLRRKLLPPLGAELFRVLLRPVKHLAKSEML